MSSVVERLHADHASMLVLLELLETEIDKIAAAETADFELLRDVMHYLISYSDAVHHPMEDLVYARLSDRSPQARAKLAPMPVEHNRIEHESRVLHESLGKIADGGMALRTTVVDSGRTYVVHLRRHIEMEEQHLFPLIHSLLDDADLDEVARILEQSKDPVFGDVVEEDFRNLREHLYAAR